MTATLPSVCPLDCPDACSLEVTITDGKVTKLEGTELNPLTDGFICSKVRRMGRHLYDEGVLVTGLAYPVVPRGDEEIRTQVNADHTEADIDAAIRAGSDLVRIGTALFEGLAPRAERSPG